jgi:hypothetical protein
MSLADINHQIPENVIITMNGAKLFDVRVINLEAREDEPLDFRINNFFTSESAVVAGNCLDRLVNIAYQGRTRGRIETIMSKLFDRHPFTCLHFLGYLRDDHLKAAPPQYKKGLTEMPDGTFRIGFTYNRARHLGYVQSYRDAVAAKMVLSLFLDKWTPADGMPNLRERVLRVLHKYKYRSTNEELNIDMPQWDFIRARRELLGGPLRTIPLDASPSASKTPSVDTSSGGLLGFKPRVNSYPSDNFPYKALLVQVSTRRQVSLGTFPNMVAAERRIEVALANPELFSAALRSGDFDAYRLELRRLSAFKHDKDPSKIEFLRNPLSARDY